MPLLTSRLFFVLLQVYVALPTVSHGLVLHVQVASLEVLASVTFGIIVRPHVITPRVVVQTRFSACVLARRRGGRRSGDATRRRRGVRLRSCR